MEVSVYSSFKQLRIFFYEVTMKLKDILPNHHINIQARTYSPDGEDMLFGYCHWTGTELVSDDGDNYSVEEEVAKYEFDDWGLVYWFESEWISGEEIDRKAN